MVVSGYSLNLYCDNLEAHPHDMVEPPDWSYKFPVEFYDDGSRSYHTTRNKARKQGWKFTRDNRCYCPNCKIPKKAKP